MKPINKSHAKNILSIDKNKKVILFGAIGGTKDYRKGSHFLEEALKILSNSYFENNEHNIQILVFGEISNKRFINNLQVDYLGSFSDDLSIAQLVEHLHGMQGVSSFEFAWLHLFVKVLIIIIKRILKYSKIHKKM